MNTGELIIESLTKQQIPLDKVLRLALVDMQSNIASAQLEVEKYPIEKLEKMSTTELIKLRGKLHARLQTISSYMEHIQVSHEQTTKASTKNSVPMSNVLINLIVTFEEVLMTHFEVGNLQETHKNISRILSRRNNQN